MSATIEMIEAAIASASDELEHVTKGTAEEARGCLVEEPES